MDSISRMTDIWFLTEPALFSAFCRHKLDTNSDMECPVRVGKGLLEYMHREEEDLLTELTTGKALSFETRENIVEAAKKYGETRKS